MEESWESRVSVISATVVGPLLREAAYIFWQTKTHTSVACIAGVKNHEADAALRITHLTYVAFTIHFNDTLPQQDPWWLHLLPFEAKHCMLIIFHTNWSPWDCMLPPCGKSPPSGRNGRNSTHGCASQNILRESSTRYHYSRFLWNGYGQENSPSMENPFRIKAWGNSSDPWGRSLWQ